MNWNGPGGHSIDKGKAVITLPNYTDCPIYPQDWIVTEYKKVGDQCVITVEAPKKRKS
jgi:hypothetical protein